nr:hypothetical protein CPGR_06114 [Mycolicibacter nonchromogenicus]
MPVLGNPKNLCAYRDLGGQIETVAGGIFDGLLQPVCRPTDGIDDLPTEFGLIGGNNQLLRRSLDRGEQGSQALVAAQEVGECRAEGFHIQWAIKVKRCCQVVNR